MKSILKTIDSAIGIGLGTGAGVLAIYAHALPNLTDIRASNPHDANVEGQRKTAAIQSAILVGAVFAITRDKNVLIIGGTVMVGIDFMSKHANGIDPATQKLDGYSAGDHSIMPNVNAPLPDYTE
jgi:hypothetical protein